ncbi:MAG: hypothetical protein GEU80_17255 [Dehalococcoidia bacterium]|nr:hypothetical protein [Dehalococcoidia bacterium]
MDRMVLAELPSAVIPDPIEDSTRREFVRLVGGGVLAAAFLAACGDDDDEPGSASTGSGTFPRTVEHALGPTRIEAEPGRVVALIDRDADTMLALGVTPVAIRSHGTR